MRKYGKGKTLTLDYNTTVEADVEVTINLKELAEALNDDPDARNSLLELLNIKPIVDEEEDDTCAMLNHLIQKSFLFSLEDEETIKNLALKYNF
jgi:hypothetical protein